jgi:glucosamine--fructose-6-phosphate aminotransferase (isomerizing)
MRTLMAVETNEAPERCRLQLELNADLMREVGQRLRRLAPPFVATLGRGSSDHAASFAKILFETRAGIPTFSHSPSIGSLYGLTSAHFRGALLIAISQSGRSPDLLAAARDVQRMGGLVLAFVNDAESPLAELADTVVPIHAGTEKSVAATKSFIGTVVALAHLTAEWTQDAELLATLPLLPSALQNATGADWSAAIPLLRRTRSMFVLGRGLTLPIAGEAALKLKETSRLHAEAFSIAEVAHGPMTLIEKDSPVLIFGPIDEAREGLRDRIEDFVARGAKVIAGGLINDVARAHQILPVQISCGPVVNAIADVQSFYGLANALAIARDLDPDVPPYLAKVTATL